MISEQIQRCKRFLFPLFNEPANRSIKYWYWLNSAISNWLLSDKVVIELRVVQFWSEIMYLWFQIELGGILKSRVWFQTAQYTPLSLIAIIYGCFLMVTSHFLYRYYLALLGSYSDVPNKWIGRRLGILSLTQLFNNYSSSPNELWVNSPWGRRPNGLLTEGLWGREE